jgi:hypothetical protein
LGLGCRTLSGGDKQNPLSSRTDRGHGSSLTFDQPPLRIDSVYNGPNLREALAKFGDWMIEIVTRAGVTGSQLLPRR